MTKDEAIKKALTLLNKKEWEACDYISNANQAADILEEALAQPEQEPVATDWERIARVQDAKLRAMCNEAGGFEKLCEVMDKYERTTPPQRTWVGLTDEEIKAFDTWHDNREEEVGWCNPSEIVAYIEAKLKEKNA